jgi:hypothetical protein
MGRRVWRVGDPKSSELEGAPDGCVEAIEYRDGGEEQRVSGFVGAFWIARKEMKRTWLSYPLSGLLVLSLGLFAVPALSGVLELKSTGAVGLRVEVHYNDFLADYLFLVVGAFLGVRAISRDYTLASWQDTYTLRLLLSRKLPISTGRLVGGRLILILFSLFLYAPAFFLPAFFLSEIGELGGSYLYFCGVWIGYGLLGSGLCLLLELTSSGKVYTLLSFGFTASLMVVLALLEWTVNLSLVGRTAELVQSAGALPAIISILAGGAALALLSRLIVQRIEKRTFVGDLSA